MKCQTKNHLHEKVAYILQEQGQKHFYFDCVFDGMLLKTGDLHLIRLAILL